MHQLSSRSVNLLVCFWSFTDFSHWTIPRKEHFLQVFRVGFLFAFMKISTKTTTKKRWNAAVGHDNDIHITQKLVLPQQSKATYNSIEIYCSVSQFYIQLDFKLLPMKIIVKCRAMQVYKSLVHAARTHARTHTCTLTQIGHKPTI